MRSLRSAWFALMIQPIRRWNCVWCAGMSIGNGSYLAWDVAGSEVEWGLSASGCIGTGCGSPIRMDGVIDAVIQFV